VRDKDDPANRLLYGVEVPPAPPEVRALSLERARAALARERSSDPWLRAWENRRLRWVWAVATVGLVVANLAVPWHHNRSGPASRDEMDASATAGDRELAAVVALPRIDSRHLQADTPNTGQRLVPPPADGSDRKENRS